MKNCIIVHCWGGYPNYCWYPWAKEKLESSGFKVAVPEMPDTDNPELDKWLEKLQETATNPNKDMFLVGHSLGCITILRYLEELDVNEEIGGVIFVAGFTDNLGMSELNTFFSTPINFEKIKKHCKNFVAIHSDNDPYIDLKYGDVLKNELNAKVIVKNQMGHFSGEIDNEETCHELPDVVESIFQL